MSVDRPDYMRSLPLRVKPTGDMGVYLVLSVSRDNLWHRVDVTMLQCNCERGTVGRSRQAKIKHGYLPYSEFCSHLRAALSFHAIATICLLEGEGYQPT